MINLIVHFFDKLEDKVRGKLSHRSVLYAFIGGSAHVIFWRGIWITSDTIRDYGWGGIWTNSNVSGFWGWFFYEPVALIWATLILLLTGLFVSGFIGERIIISGLKKEKKITDKTEEEVKEEGKDIERLESKVDLLIKEITILKMNWLKNKKTVAVHSGSFHADDVFAVAILSLFLGYIPKIFRTRDVDIIKKVDYVLDVGREYDPTQNKFDHHGEGWDEKRSNGILYATSGLIWKEMGLKITGSSDLQEIIDKKIIQPIDANDNGIEVATNNYEDVKTYSIFDYLYSLNSTWAEKNENDKKFIAAVKIARDILIREIKIAKDFLIGKKVILDIYKKSEDKRIIVLDHNYEYEKVVNGLPDVLLVIRPAFLEKKWHITTVKKNFGSFQMRIDFPLAWAGKSGEEFQKISGVPDAIFCHNKRFIAVSKSKEGALKLAQIALQTL